ncbi:C-terminal binding protein [Litchfieldia salsa]|uniref:D-3-phosphoglycerate dehydrogenase n=1 Tax=Litchfieldia salsa TaxID=930152 RepID=A0A1H0VPR4_9BACI|nr:C-terminal binding protein [Litchfieldia salsa]SDP80592.1 D-3-phosphoglycerate dehydrogenase [Litchfieldia salsa]
MKTYKVVVTDYEYNTFEPEEKVLAQLGIQLILTQCQTEEEVINSCHDADALINQYAPITRNVIENLKQCKVISRYGVGYNTIDVDAATEKGIIVGNVTDYCLDEVSDHAMALLLSCARKTVLLNNEVKSGNWDYKVSIPIFRLRGRTLGLVGLGNIPQSVAKKAQAFGLKVIAFDPFIPKEIAKQLNVELVTLEELCEQSDYLSVHAPLNEHTKGMISYQQFKKMKKEAFIINTSRGPVIEEGALIEALQTGRIAGAGLDVVEIEPIDKSNPLFTMDNVILNPHVAWYSEESEMELKRKTAENVLDVLKGYYPSYLVNKNVKEKVRLKDQ